MAGDLAGVVFEHGPVSGVGRFPVGPCLVVLVEVYCEGDPFVDVVCSGEGASNSFEFLDVTGRGEPVGPGRDVAG